MLRSKQFALGIFLCAFVFCGCNSTLSRVSDLTTNNDSISNPGTVPDTVSSPPAVEETSNPPVLREVLESYSDDRNVGRRRQNKIEIDIVNNGPFREYHPTNLAIIRFYSREPSRKWVLKQTLEIEDDAVGEADPKFDDFNNDGLKDVTFVSSVAARGANEIRTLLIYNKSADKLIHVKNSTEYPNIRYNRTLNCIDAFLVYGGTQTVFLKLHGDMLKEFASVENFENRRTVTIIGQNGKERILKEQKIHDDQLYDRFETFSPLTLIRDR